jgi:hypothetical protein
MECLYYLYSKGIKKNTIAALEDEVKVFDSSFNPLQLLTFSLGRTFIKNWVLERTL